MIMEHQEISNKFVQLLSDEGFVEKLASVTTAAEVAAVFRAEGLDMTEDDARQVMEYVTHEGELSEDALDTVAGGIVWTAVYVSCFVIGVGVGLLHGAVKRLKAAWG